ncbi:MAG: YigZ family protein [Clostridia bacterium]|nr:YigZ family protein [Eubacteriales bacterium]MDD3866802.1 YigZ family protein [Eubacteriales bacterium]MDD4460701.1 YigZ family protein [Eubacteriales bacterium]NCC47581.1 YigZ family protein [Clostridia bacterium]
MLLSYRSVKQYAQIEMEERKSRFIATCQPIDHEDDATGFIESVRQQYPDASHHVFAWLLGRDLHLQRYSDDGEPQGTAGMPVMNVLLKNNLIQTAIVVTRYYGGIQLGAGGLVRAYGGSAALAVDAAQIADYQLCRRHRIVIEYGHLDRMKRYLDQARIRYNIVSYGMDVEIVAAVPLDQSVRLSSDCADLTAGAALIEPADTIYLPLPPPDPPPADAVNH